MDKDAINLKLSKLINNCREYLKDLEKAQSDFNLDMWVFSVDLISRWADYGETHISFDGKPGDSLDDVMRKAKKKFMEVNNRSDVQAVKKCYVKFLNKIKVEI